MGKYIKSYLIFKEAVDPEAEDINITQADQDPKLDDQNQESEEKSLQSIDFKLKEFNNKKRAIDNAYKNSPNDQVLKITVEKILGKDLKKRNEFLVQYDQLCKDERLLVQLKKQIVDDTSSIAKYNKEIQRLNDLLRNEQDVTNQDNLRNSIKQTSDAIDGFNQNIKNNNKNIPKLKQSVMRKAPFIDSIKLKISQISNMKTKK